MDEIIGTADYAGEQAKITKLGENKVFFLPYLMGEAFSSQQSQARGTFMRTYYGQYQSRYDTGRFRGRGFCYPGFL